jgi:hypothetical protein
MRETSADTAARAIAIRAQRTGRSPVAPLKRRLVVASIAEQLDTTPERLAAPAPPTEPQADHAGLARRSLLGRRIADALGLPIPRLTATVNPPLNKGTLGAVVVDGYDPPRHDGDPRPPVRRGRVRCTLCDQMGHARSNRKFHPMRSV